MVILSLSVADYILRNLLATTLHSNLLILFVTAATEEFFKSTSPKFSMQDIQALLQQLQPDSSNSTSQVLSVTLGTFQSWYFDFSCYNNMTYDSSIFTPKTSLVIAPIVHTIDNLLMQ